MDNVYEYLKLEPAIVRGPNKFWQMTFIKPDQTMHHNIFPAETMHIRATEFQHDLGEEFDRLLETTLYEPMQPDIQNDERDPGFAAGYKTPIQDVMWAGRLFTAETIQDAREARALRMEWMENRRHVWDLTRLRKDGAHNKLWRERKADEDYIKQLRVDVAAVRREVRGREDGNPLKG